MADYIILHPSEKYTPQKMAEMADLSKQRFSSLFKINMGKTPMEYVREIRLTTAARALLVSNDNINDLSLIHIYSDDMLPKKEEKKEEPQEIIPAKDEALLAPVSGKVIPLSLIHI